MHPPAPNPPNLPKPPNQSPRGRVYPPPTPSHRPLPLISLPPWRTQAPLDTSKSNGKTIVFLTFSLFGPTKPTHRGQSRNFWKSAPRLGRKHFFANGAKGNLCKKLLFRLLGASGCLFVASGPQSGFAKYLTNMCIICTWAPLMASFGFLMLRSSSIFTLFYLLPLLFPWFFKSVLIYSFVFLKLCSLPW